MKVLLNTQQVSDGVARMALDISQHYGSQPLTILGIMTGSVVLLADLIRQLAMPLRVGVVQASSYRGGTKRGELVINSDLMPDVTHRHVLLVDDIFDTGNTLFKLIELVNQLGPTSVRSAVLLRKTGCQKVVMQPDFVGFSIPDEFVVGYGLDYQDEYRNLSYVGTLEAADLSRHAAAPGPTSP